MRGSSFLQPRTRAQRIAAGRQLPSAPTASEALRLVESAAQQEAAATSSDEGSELGELPPAPPAAQPPNITQNPLFVPCDAEEMEELPLQSLKRLLAPGQSAYGGETGPPFYEWVQERTLHLNQLVGKALAANRAAPHPSILIGDLTMNCAPRSQAQTFLQEGARLLCPSIEAAAARGLFPGTDLTREMRNLALNVHAGQPEYETRLDDLLSERLGPLQQRAQEAGRLADVTGAQQPVPAEAAAAAAAADGGDPAGDQPPAAHQPALSGAILDPHTAQLFTPGLAVATKLLLLAEMRFGTATRQQEAEFRTLKQKQGESYRDLAYRLQLLERTVAHRTVYTALYKATLYLESFTDRDCATWVRSQMLALPAASQTVDKALQYAEAYEEGDLERRQVQQDCEAARRAAGATTSVRPPKPSNQAGNDKPLTDAQLLKEINKYARQLSPDHDLAPCILHGPQCRHTNAACRAPEHPRNQGRASAGAPWQQRSPARGGSAGGPYGSRPAAASMAMSSHYPEPAAAAAGPPQAPDVRGQGSRHVGPDCRWCHRPGGHYGGPCYINEPHMAPPHWRPPGQVSHTSPDRWREVLEHYRRRCAQMGVYARLPTQGSPRASPPGSPRGSAFGGPSAAAGAARSAPRNPGAQGGSAALATSSSWGAGSADLHAAAAYSDADPSLGGWWDACACVVATPAAAGVTTRSRQPRSFVAPDNLSPPAHLTRSAAAEPNTPAAADPATPTAAGTQVQITLTLPAGRGAQLLSSLAAAGAQATSTNAGLALAGNSTPDKVRLQSLFEGFEAGYSVGWGEGAATPRAAASATSQEPARCSSSSSSESSAGDHPPSARTSTQLVLGELADTLLMGKDPERLVAEYMAASEAPGMHTFVGNAPEQGVSIETSDGRLLLIPRAVEDTGCVPTIITASFAKQAGIHWRPFAPGQAPRVRDIAGKPADFVGMTTPITLVLASGTPHEVRLEQPQGCLVMGGDSATDMYDMVVGRRALLSVAGFVHPLTRQFVYSPNLRNNDLRTHTLPVRLGAPGASQPASANAAADCSPFLCAAAAQGANQEPLSNRPGAHRPSWLISSFRAAAGLALFLLFLFNAVSHWRLLHQAPHARGALMLSTLGTACLIGGRLLQQAAGLAARTHSSAPDADSLLDAPLPMLPPDDRGDMLGWATHLATFRCRC